MNIRRELHLIESNGQCSKPPTAYVLSRTKRRTFCRFLKSVQFSDGFASNLSRNVVEEQGKLYGLKSHDCHIQFNMIYCDQLKKKTNVFILQCYASAMRNNRAKQLDQSRHRARSIADHKFRMVQNFQFACYLKYICLQFDDFFEIVNQSRVTNSTEPH